MALTLATELANYAAGIGTQGATLKIDSANKRVGVGTTNPQGPEGSLQVGTGITFFGNTGIISAIGGKFSGDFTVGGTLTYEDVQNVNSSGVGTFSGGINVVGGGLTVTGVSTFFSRVSIADSIVHTGDINTSLRFPAADTFTVETGGTEALRINSSQQLLLGTTTEGHDSANDFTISDSGDVGITIRSTDSNQTQISFSDATSGTGEYAGQISYFHTDDYMRFRTNSEERVRITGIGSVGIGTELPAKFLEVAVGNNVSNGILVKGNSSPLIQIDEGSGVSASFGLDGNGSYFGPTSNHYQVFRTNSTERVRITSAGLVGIGTINPNRKLVISQANSTAYSGTDFDQDYHVLKLNNFTDSKTVGMQFLIGSNGEAAITATETSDGATDLIFGTRGSGSRAERLRIDSAGDVGIGSENPARKLDVNGIVRVIETVEAYNTSGGSSDWFVSSDSFGFHNGNGVAFNAGGGLFRLGISGSEKVRVDVGGNVNITGITTANQLFEGSTRVATTGKAIAMAFIFG